jgi:azurin
MRPGFIAVLSMLMLTGLPGCGGHAGAGLANAGGPTDAEIPVTDDNGMQVVQLTGNDTMHYNGDRFTVHTGKTVRVEVQNTGHMPRDQMMHNFVLLKPGTDATAYNLASAMAKSNGFMPPDQMDAVIAYTKMAGPGETQQVEFPAPPPGDYTFLCNYSGHFAAGMRGTMTVVP